MPNPDDAWPYLAPGETLTPAVVFVDLIAGTATLRCPGRGATLVFRGGRIDLGDERRTA